jgi:hypothetical protein
MVSLRKIPDPRGHSFVYAKKTSSNCKLAPIKFNLPLIIKSENLVVKDRLEVLLACWEHFVFLLALEVGQLGDCFVDDLESSLDLVLGNNERWRQTNNVLVSGLGLRRRKKRSVSVRSIKGV